MLTQPTLEKLNAMKLTGLVQALQQQLGSGEYARLSFEERLGLLVDAEWTAREERRRVDAPPVELVCDELNLFQRSVRATNPHQVN